MKFEERLAQLMESKGITNYRLAKEMNCSPTSVANWLDGIVPRGNRLDELAEFFGVSVDYLLGADEPLVNNDPELTEYLEELKNNPEMRILFNLTKGATKEDVKKAVDIVKAFLGKE